MELQRLLYENVYGHLSGDISFQKAENFLVGINGCGKTTMLNFIKWLLCPSLPDLCTTNHDSVSLTFNHGETSYTIFSKIYVKKKETMHELKLINNDDETKRYKSLTTHLFINPKDINSNEILYRLKEDYSRYVPTSEEFPTLRFLQEELPTPIFIGLDRDIDDNFFVNNRKNIRFSQRIKEGRPAFRSAEVLMRNAFNTNRRRLEKLNNSFNLKFLQLSLEGPLSKINEEKTSLKTADMLPKIQQMIEKIREESKENASSNELPCVSDIFLSYLGNMQGCLTDVKTEEHLGSGYVNKIYDNALKMSDLLGKFRSETSNIENEISNYTDAVNSFLVDSGKKIVFDENTGDPSFISEYKKGSMSSIELSSGEVQIVILLAYFAFLAKEGHPIIIDEPELSLHIEWQRLFVSAVKKVLPKECQTIMATHSPEICGASDVNVQPLIINSPK